MKCDQERFLKCRKNNLCHLCDGERLYTPPKEYVKPIRKKKKEGMDFEKRVTKKYNKTVGQKVTGSDTARRRPNSGAIWSLPGDIVTRDALFEAKERGTRTSSGEKTISVHREWLEKVAEEAKSAAKQYWFLPFGFKNDKKIYVTTDFDMQLQIIDLLHDYENMVKEMQEYIKDLESQLNTKGGTTNGNEQ
jgi:hypothetical protein